MGVSFLSPTEIAEYMKKGACLIDLREVLEYKKGHIKNSRCIPYETFTEQYKRLMKNKTYILYCDRGTASIKAARMMIRDGYQVFSLAGGFAAYQKEMGGEIVDSSKFYR